MQEVIEGIREKIGKAPRRFGFFQRRYLKSRPPNWMSDDDPLMEFYRNQNRLLENGRVVWGAIVQANSLLFKPGPEDHPAMVLYAEDQSLDACPDWLENLAGDVFRLKNTTPQNPEERKLADMITGEMERGLGWSVPKTITEGKSIRSTCVMVIRRHLPDGILDDRLYPILIHPNTKAVMIVPSRFWTSVGA